MKDATIKCPKCGELIELDKAMAGPMVDKMRRENEALILSIREDAVRERDALKLKITGDAIKKAREEAEDESAQARVELQHKLEKAQHETSKMATELEERETKLAEAQKTQAELLKKSRALDEERREMELTIEKRIGEQLESTRAKAKQEAEDSLKLKVSEKELQISSMQATIETLKQKAEQGSMQIQGECAELELEKILREKFPYDSIVPVPKGINGADCVQEVKDSTGKLCGKIIYESKRTKTFAESWISKLKDDQRIAKVDLGVLVSQTLPKNVISFDCIDGVWVCGLNTVLPVASLLRQSLMEIQMAKNAGTGQKTKMQILYDYLTGLQFRQRMQAIVENYGAMQEDLLRERKLITKQWAKREMQLTNVMESAVGLHGDIIGIAGGAVAEIPGLEIKQITKED